MLKQSLCALAVLVGVSTAANALTLFSDDFNADSGALNGSLLNWQVTNGTIDVIGNGFFDFYPGNGNYLDMDGSTGQGGTIVASQLFNLVAGTTYVLMFDTGKNGGNVETLNFGIGSFSSSLTLALGGVSALVTNTYSFLATANEANVQLSFADLGGDNQGVVLDNVNLSAVSAVPLPAAAPLLMLGLAGLGVFARRRKVAKSA